MKGVIVIAAILSLTCSAPQKRGAIPVLGGKIVGGQDAQIEDYPFLVSLLYYGSHICGGSLISSRYVVTAAHCAEAGGLYTVRAGSSILNSGGTVVSVSTIYDHPSYDSWTLDFDISILYLSSDLTFGSGIGAVSLPIQNQEIVAGEEAVVLGWGTLSEGGLLPSQLQAVIIPVVSQEDCRAVYGESAITNYMMCAGVLDEGGKDACQGDSGGPLIIDGQLIGIVSWGYGCARPSYPGVYSSVPALRSFIADVSGI